MTSGQIIKKNEERLKEENDKIERLRSAFNKTASTPEGQIVFKHLMSISHYQKHNIVFNPQTGNINKDASDYLEARRSLYLDLRKYIDSKYLKLIEYD